ncbi:MAG: type I restriction enzyme HsdR N-terminal domain-containing protein [Flavobacteriales bacterium]|nr:type I restriction enzyme HsdR N-terminal domain-containing protein [Flavobacteriales bacterium]
MQFNWEKLGIKTRVEKNTLYIFDPIRKKYIQETPEEQVRQFVIYHLVQDLGYPAASISVEKQITYLKLKKRFDILIFANGQPKLLIECKAPFVELSEDTIHQIAQYNFALNAPFFAITNGRNSLIYRVDTKSKKIISENDFPPYQRIIS